jgi:glycosyltransferase involved in cell wall biosynthesis
VLPVREVNHSGEGKRILETVPRVSVIVPTFNRAGLLRRSLDSIQMQSFPDWECLIVDDGSTDATPDLVASRAEADPRVRAIRIEHGGTPGRGRNAGIAGSRGEFVAFLDDDDEWKPGKLERQVSLFDAEPGAGLVFSRVERFGDEHGPWPRVLPERPELRSLLASNFIACSTVIVRRSVIERAGLFDESLPLAQDFDLWLRILRRGPIRGIPEVLARYRVDRGRQIRELPAEREAVARIIEKFRDDVPARFLRPWRRRIHRARARAAKSFGESLAEWWKAITA